MRFDIYQNPNKDHLWVDDEDCHIDIGKEWTKIRTVSSWCDVRVGDRITYLKDQERKDYLVITSFKTTILYDLEEDKFLAVDTAVMPFKGVNALRIPKKDHKFNVGDKVAVTLDGDTFYGEVVQIHLFRDIIQVKDEDNGLITVDVPARFVSFKNRELKLVLRAAYDKGTVHFFLDKNEHERFVKVMNFKAAKEAHSIVTGEKNFDEEIETIAKDFGLEYMFLLDLMHNLLSKAGGYFSATATKRADLELVFDLTKKEYGFRVENYA